MAGIPFEILPGSAQGEDEYEGGLSVILCSSLIFFCIYPIVMKDMIVLCILKVSIEFPFTYTHSRDAITAIKR